MIYSTEDKRIKEIGKILASDPSRKILETLFSETLTAKQIAQKTDLDIPLAKYHINRMLDLGIIKIEKTTKSVKAQDMKYYTATNLAIVILPSSIIDRAKNSKMFVRSFQRIYKITAVGVTAISTWFVTQFLQKNFGKLKDTDGIPISKSYEEIGPKETPSFFNMENIMDPSDIFWSLIVTIAVTIGIVIIIFKKR